MKTKVTRAAKRERPSMNAARVKKSRALLVKRGGAKIPGGWLQPEPAAALHTLHESGYAETRVGCIALALVEATERQRRREERRKTRGS